MGKQFAFQRILIQFHRCKSIGDGYFRLYITIKDSEKLGDNYKAASGFEKMFSSIQGLFKALETQGDINQSKTFETSFLMLMSFETQKGMVINDADGPAPRRLDSRQLGHGAL